MPNAMVTFNGRITLPAQVRKQLGLKTGDNIEFVEVEKDRFAISCRSRSSVNLDCLDPQAESESSIDEMEEVTH
jgi:AbrB family looped-hinge helix DNA binding protein